MAVLTNTITSGDLTYALDQEFIASFDQSVDQLGTLLGIGSLETLAAGTALKQYTVTGTLDTTTVAEGDEVPLSMFTQTETAIGEMTVKPYRKLTTAQAILKHGFDSAVLRTDDKMMKLVRAGIVDQFFTFLGNGTGTATGTTFKAALIQADATLSNALDANNDPSEGRAFFVNPLDYGDWAATNDVQNDGAGSVFGLTYIVNLAGIAGTVFMSSRVTKGTVIATPVENIHAYVPDFGALASAGFDYAVSESGTIGVHHDVAYNRTSAETYVLAGLDLVPEVKDYIVKSTIAASA